MTLMAIRGEAGFKGGEGSPRYAVFCKSGNISQALAQDEGETTYAWGKDCAGLIRRALENNQLGSSDA